MLPDILEPGVRLVICGTAVGTASAARSHYYAGPGQEFWSLLHLSGLSPVLLTPSRDQEVLRYGIGLTDLAKNIAQSHDAGLREHYDVAAFQRKMTEVRPSWVAFHGKEAARSYAESIGIGRGRPPLGAQGWTVAGARVFVLPSGSGSNRRPLYDGRPSRVEWWADLCALLDEVTA